MLINLSNHPSANWSAEQTAAAHKLYGEIVDLPFPVVEPSADETQIAQLTDEYLSRVLQLVGGQSVTVHLMGEMTFCFTLVARLQKRGILCVASTTRRVTIETEPGIKQSIFRFVRFRNYPQL